MLFANSSKQLLSKDEPSHDGHLSKCSSRHDPFTNYSGKHMRLCNLACPKSTFVPGRAPAPSRLPHSASYVVRSCHDTRPKSPQPCLMTRDILPHMSRCLAEYFCNFVHIRISAAAFFLNRGLHKARPTTMSATDAKVPPDQPLDATIERALRRCPSICKCKARL
jgi:hypothetical protein